MASEICHFILINNTQEIKMSNDVIFRIKNFGNDKDCTSIESLICYIQNYRGKSVTIQDLRPNGQCHFVDVTNSGEMYSSYGSRPKFEPDLMLA
jgi:hypothetical protein